MAEKRSKDKNLRELSDDELRGREQELRGELFNLRFSHAMGQLENPRQMKAKRIELARVLTVFNQRER